MGDNELPEEDDTQGDEGITITRDTDCRERVVRSDPEEFQGRHSLISLS